MYRNLPVQLWNRKKLIRLTWDDVTLAVDHIAKRIHIDNFSPDVIIGISRGGLVPALLLSHKLGVRNLEIVSAKYYDSGHYPQRLSEKPLIGYINFETQYCVALLVDDIAGSGETILEVSSRLKDKVRSIKTATLVKNIRCPIHLSYFFAIVDDFVVFPWEDSTKELN